MVEDFGLLRFLPLAIEDRASVARVLEDVDKANGCAFSGLAATAAPMPPELVYGAGVKGGSQGCNICVLPHSTREYTRKYALKNYVYTKYANCNPGGSRALTDA